MIWFRKVFQSNTKDTQNVKTWHVQNQCIHEKDVEKKYKKISICAGKYNVKKGSNSSEMWKSLEP